jgi:hypothetical protein
MCSIDEAFIIYKGGDNKSFNSISAANQRESYYCESDLLGISSIFGRNSVIDAQPSSYNDVFSNQESTLNGWHNSLNEALERKNKNSKASADLETIEKMRDTSLSESMEERHQSNNDDTEIVNEDTEIVNEDTIIFDKYFYDKSLNTFYCKYSLDKSTAKYFIWNNYSNFDVSDIKCYNNEPNNIEWVHFPNENAIELLKDKLSEVNLENYSDDQTDL